MTTSEVGHSIRWHRSKASDDFTTPEGLAKLLISKVPLVAGDTILDPFRGTGNFYHNLPGPVNWCEIKEGRDFFKETGPYDWLVSNPPYSMLDDVLNHSAEIAAKGIAYLLAFHGLTARRLERMEAAGFGLTTLHLTKVFRWYGMSLFCVWERGKPGILSYDRKVWYNEPR